MQTLADFKRLPTGTEIETLQGIPKYQNVVRKIEHKQTNGIKFEGGSWLYYPNAKETTILDEKTILIESQDQDGNIWNTLKYKIV